MSDALQQARHHFSQGIEAVEAGRLSEAEQQFAQALHFAPDRPSILTNLGVVRVRLGRCAEALPLLERAAGQETDNLEAWVHLGMARAALGQLAAALGAFDHALAQRADIAQAWVHRGSALRELGRHPEAAASFERAIALGADDDLVRYYLASVRSGESPAAPPRAYVQDLFDGYADGFETHLQSLDYQAHRQLVQGLLARCAPPWQGVLDLGCGTGWVGRELRRAAPGPSCGTVTGIDLSSRMLAQARALGGYDELLQADIGEWLAQAPGAGARWQIAFAADVSFMWVRSMRCCATCARACGPVAGSRSASRHWPMPKETSGCGRAFAMPTPRLTSAALLARTAGKCRRSSTGRSATTSVSRWRACTPSCNLREHPDDFYQALAC